MSNHVSVCKHKHLDLIPSDILTEQKFHKSAFHPLNQFAFLFCFFVVVRKGRFLKFLKNSLCFASLESLFNDVFVTFSLFLRGRGCMSESMSLVAGGVGDGEYFLMFKVQI